MPRFPGVFPTTQIGTLRGQQIIDQAAQPAAGAEWSYTVQGSYYRRLVSLTYVLTTSATVASRFAGVRITDGKNVLFLLRPPVGHTAGTTVAYEASSAVTIPTGSVAAGSIVIPFPNVFIAPGYAVQSTSVGLDAGDQFAAPVFWWEAIDQAELQDEHNRIHEHAAGRPSA